MNSREFALQVVTELQQAGFQALWAGGCVRDQLLGRKPKDYDVATDATPDAIRELFGKKRTLPIGAAFGVITVLGPKEADPIEVATFRRDAGYSDGRRPDAVEFTDAREDAIRRDFTINGMFFDPIAEKIIDYVGGQEDLQRKQIRAIGNPHERIDEDKLRMLRGVRFASTYQFELENETLNAIRQHASEISVVSEERIGAEVTRMLSHPNKATAAQLLLESGLLREALPAAWLEDASSGVAVGDAFNDQWKVPLDDLSRLESNVFESVAAVLFQSYLHPEEGTAANRRHQNQRLHNRVDQLQQSWRLTNQQRDGLIWIIKHWRTLAGGDVRKWSEIQPLLININAANALDVASVLSDSMNENSNEEVRSKAAAGASAGDDDGKQVSGLQSGVAFCRARLDWPKSELDPAPLLTGKDLIEMGIQPGPKFKPLLQMIRDGQLDGEIGSADEARKLVTDR
jgi:tRNA nucleotidyltransferase/poly(A) polymerase